jgi:hypothetical protein
MAPIAHDPRGRAGRRLSSWLLLACGVWLVGLALYFIFLRPRLLPEDVRFMGATLAKVRTALPGLEPWLAHVFVVLGGFIAGAGVLTILVAIATLPRRPPAAPLAIALSGALTVGLMSATNFSLGSDFKWVLLAPAMAWLAALVSYLLGR